MPDGGLFERGVTYDIVQSMHDEALAEEISQNGGIGRPSNFMNSFQNMYKKIC